jgi:hypothetical protein
MSETVRALARRGLISTKAMNATLAKTRPQKSKMADFDGKSKDEGKGGSIAGTNRAGIDANQRKGSAAGSTPSGKGGMTDSRSPVKDRPTMQPGSKVVGAKMSAKGKSTVGVRHAPPPQGGMYGGGGRGTQ